jgi:hypothetical protein
MPIREVNSPVNRMSLPKPQVDVKAVLRASNPRRCGPQVGVAPPAPASSASVELPVTK